jgi:hypothetical protein
MKRVLVPELLDSLPHGDPGAEASRKDLRLLNGVMGNFRWLVRRLEDADPGTGILLEIGAGDGMLAREVCSRMPSLAAHYHALDFAPKPTSWPEKASWHQQDVWSEASAELLNRTTILVANLVLHHFDDAALRRLGSLLPCCRMLLACEPARKERHVWQGRMLFPVLHPVTRHDMTASIRAGFRGSELMDALGFRSEDWRCGSSETWLGAYRIIAERNPSTK